MRFEKKVVLVTGASRGIGRQIAIDFAKNGAAAVIVNYVASVSDAEDVVKSCQSHGADAVAIKADISKPKDVVLMMDEIKDRFGRLDILVNNASHEDNRFIWEIPDEAWLKTITTTLYGPFLCTRHALPLMGKGGRIINISSIHDVTPRKAATSYCSAKAGLLMMTKVLALELAPYEITVNAVSPGLTLTDRTAGGILDKDGNVDPLNAVVDRNPMKRPADVSEISNPVLFLAEDTTSYISGTTIYVDGAYMHNLCPERPGDDMADYIDSILADGRS